MELWRDIPHGTLAGSIADVWAEEQSRLMHLPPAFDGFVEQSKRVSPTCLISFERNRYSVPASFANRPVSLRVYPGRLVVAAEGQILCEHERLNEATVRQLHRCEFIDGAQNVVLIGGPGTGKTHVATALGIQTIEHHRKKVRFFSTIELVNTLEQEKARRA